MDDGKKEKISRETNEAVFTDLTLACQDDVSFSIVTKSVTDDLPEGDASLAWQSLRERFYQQDSSAALVLLKSEYNKRKLENAKKQSRQLGDQT